MRSEGLPFPPHPAPNVCDDRETPLRGRGTAGDIDLIGQSAKRNTFADGSGQQIGDLSARQKHAIASPTGFLDINCSATPKEQERGHAILL